MYTLARETHVAELLPGQQTKVQHSFSYSDGFGREIQKKIQAEPGPIAAGGPEVNPRWVGSGWTIFNNKGKPVRQYEPFFSASHAFEFANIVGVSSILFYDPVERVVATLHPNHTYEKVVFDPWRQESWDVNDTVLAVEPGFRPGRRRLLSRAARLTITCRPGTNSESTASLARKNSRRRRRRPSMRTHRPSPTSTVWVGRSWASLTTGSSGQGARRRVSTPRRQSSISKATSSR